MTFKLLLRAIFLFIISGCSAKDVEKLLTGLDTFTCDVGTYSYVNVHNRANEDVVIRFCSDPQQNSYPSIEAHVPPANTGWGQNFYATIISKTEKVKDYAANGCDHASGELTNIDGKYYASISSSDLVKFDICFNSVGYYLDSYGTKIPQQYIIVNKNTACPAGSNIFDQSQNPCQ